MQGVHVFDALRVAGEAFVSGQGGLLQNGLAEPHPLPLVLNAEEDHLLVAALEGTVGGYGGVRRNPSCRRSARGSGPVSLPSRQSRADPIQEELFGTVDDL